MTASPIHEALELPADADLSQVEQAFMQNMKERIQKVAESYDEDVVLQEEKELRNLFGKFFNYTIDWITEELKKTKGEPNHAEASKLKTTARDVLKALQDQLVVYAISYMHINRWMTLVRDEIKQESFGLNISGAKIVYTSDTGTMLMRHKKRKREILEHNVRLNKAAAILKQAAPFYDAFRDALIRLGGREEGEKVVRSISSALRISDERKLKRACKTIEEMKKKISVDKKGGDQLRAEAVDNVKKFAAIINHSKDILSSDDGKVYLHAREINVVLGAHEREVTQANKFIAKYNLPYMEHKLKTLYTQKDKLLVLGSLESLMTLYLRLIKGIAKPLADLREYEAEVLDHVKYLLDGRFQEVPKIQAHAEKTVKEFSRNLKEYREQIKPLQEKLLEEDKAAEGG